MILSAQTIRRFCETNSLITPFCPRTVVNGKTFGLSSAGYDVRVDLGSYKDHVSLQPGDFILAATMEHFIMPNTIIGFVCDKSSWVRRGVENIGTTVLEPGWRGYLTLELLNHSRQTRTIKPGDPIAQIVFQWLDEPTKQPYEGKYQDQKRGPQEAISE